MNSLWDSHKYPINPRAIGGVFYLEITKNEPKAPFLLVRETGLEPARRKAYAPKAYVYTNFTTRAATSYYSTFSAILQHPGPQLLTNLSICGIIDIIPFENNQKYIRKVVFS